MKPCGAGVIGASSAAGVAGALLDAAPLFAFRYLVTALPCVPSIANIFALLKNVGVDAASLGAAPNSAVATELSRPSVCISNWFADAADAGTPETFAFAGAAGAVGVATGSAAGTYP
jgi:hypothetical protein